MPLTAAITSGSDTRRAVSPESIAAHSPGAPTQSRPTANAVVVAAPGKPNA